MAKINPKSTALILIEMQNDFLSTKGKLNHLVADVVEKTSIVENANSAINLTRKEYLFIGYRSSFQTSTKKWEITPWVF